MTNTEINFDILTSKGFRVEATGSDIVAYGVFGPRGSAYSLVRNRNNPNLFGVVNLKRATGHAIRGTKWFRVINNTLTAS